MTFTMWSQGNKKLTNLVINKLLRCVKENDFLNGCDVKLTIQKYYFLNFF